jgi:hypothetical protein
MCGVIASALVVASTVTCFASASEPQLKADKVIEIASREAVRQGLDPQGYAPKLSYDSDIAVWTVEYIQKVDRPKPDAARFSVYVDDRTHDVVSQAAVMQTKKQHFQRELAVSSARARAQKRSDEQRLQSFFEDEFEPVYRLKDIDTAVLKALQAPLGKRERFADRGQPFQVSDVIPPGEDALPLRRIVLAGHNPNKWFMLYTRGGFVQRDVLVMFSAFDHHWKIDFTASGASGPETLDELRQAIRSGHYSPGPASLW